MSYKYGLDPSSKKYSCPQCKQKTFVLYLDNESKLPVDKHLYGRCDRENSCNYELHPSSDPELAAKSKAENLTPAATKVVVQMFPEEKIWSPVVHRTKTCISPLHKFLGKALLIPNEHLIKWGVYSDTDSSGNELTVYVYKNADGKICNLKWFKYGEDGHRDKNYNAFSLANKSSSKKSPPHPPKIGAPENFSGTSSAPSDLEYKYQLCLYGEHLLDPEKKKIVCVVESEKTAAIASFFYQQFDWVACGSNNGLTDGKEGKPDKIAPLKGREVYWLCDADKASRMFTKDDTIRPSSIRHLIEHIEKFAIVDLYPDKNNGYDIGDAIIDGIRPEIIPTWRKGIDDVEKAKQKFPDNDTIDYDLPDGVDFETVKYDIRKYMHFEHDGRIYICRKRKATDGEKGAPFYSTDITNFTIKSLGMIASKVDPRRLIEIKNIHGLTKVLQVPTSAFTSQNEFTNFIESEGNFQYDGVGTDLKKVRSKMYDTMEEFEEIENLGWHRDGYMIFANGAYNGKFSPINRYGFVTLGGKRFYIEALSALSRESEDDWEDEKKFIYRQSEVKLKDWANLFCQVHKDNGRIMLAWFITNIFRDFIYQHFKFFPHTFLFGPAGTGKSQLGWSVRALTFTGIVKPFNLNTGTAVAFHREFQNFRNTPAWMDEYGNSIPYERVQGLKAAYDGVGHKKSVKDSDKRTKSTQVNRGIMISGQELPIADIALFKRCILLQFNQTEFNELEKKMYADLQALEAGGLTHITAGFTHFRKLIETEYMKEFDTVITDMMKMAEEMQFDPEDRILRNSAIALTTMKVLQTKIAEMLPYTYEDLKKTMMVNMKNQMSLISNANETNTFWEIVAFLAKERVGTTFRIVEGEDFAFEAKKTVKIVINKADVLKEFPEVTELIFIRFTRIIPLYAEAFKRQKNSNASPMDRGSLLHYLQHSKPYVGLISNYTFKDSRTSCYAFNYEMMKGMGIYLGGSELNKGTPPPPVQPGEPGTAEERSDFSEGVHPIRDGGAGVPF